MNSHLPKTLIIPSALLTGAATAQLSGNNPVRSPSMMNNILPQGFPANDKGMEKTNSGWSLHLDNDFLIPGGKRDQDCTGGLGLTLSGSCAKHSWWSLNSVLGLIDAATKFDDISDYNHSFPMQ